MYSILYYDFVAAFGNHEVITEDMIKDVCEGAETPILQFVLACPRMNQDVFSLDEQMEYNVALIEKVATVMGVELSQTEKSLCVLSIAGVRPTNEELMDKYNEVIYMEVEEGSWQWLLRENIRYAQLGALTSQGRDFAKIRELVSIMKQGTASFTSAWNAAQKSVITNLKNN